MLPVSNWDLPTPGCSFTGEGEGRGLSLPQAARSILVIHCCSFLAAVLLLGGFLEVFLPLRAVGKWGIRGGMLKMGEESPQ